MLYLKNKYFTRWARKQGISDGVLCASIREFENGLFEAYLGNGLFKKRIALPGKGKSGGTRTILFYQRGKKLIFCFGFNKNQQENLSNTETAFLHKLADGFQKMSDETIIKTIHDKNLIKISGMEAS